jgi:4-alpha-glucanotransferase
VRRYLACDGRDVPWDMIRAAWMSVADLAVTPLQDVLGLGSAARMNTPGQPAGNWSWRLLPDQLQSWHRDRLADLTALYAR